MRRTAIYTANATRQALAAVVAFVLSTSVFPNPVLDHVAAGQVSIEQVPNNTVINQSSQKAIINWQSFNIGDHESTHFNQPQGGIALNRINSTQGVSQIYGRLTASGQIILVNPAGIYFGPGAYVNVGGLIATTANISDQDFLNSYYRFTKDSSYNGAIVNQGTIIAANHGLIALVGGAVSNEGYLEANLGQVVLAAGNAYTMTFAGNDLVSFAVDRGVNTHAIDKNGSSMRNGVLNKGSVVATGGRIFLTAKDAAGILDNIINMQGIAQTKSIYQHEGSIIFSGDPNGGVVRIAGSLDASSETTAKAGTIITKGFKLVVEDGAQYNVSSAAGDGGFIDTSGTYDIQIGNISINTSAPYGQAGTWLIDPADINITTVDANMTGSSPFMPTDAGATLNVATLIAALSNGNVTVQTTNDGFNGSGNITVSSEINWDSSHTLLLQALNNIIINSPINGINGSLHLHAVNTPASITTGVNGSIDVNNFNLLQGQWHQVGALPSFNVRNNFQINSGVLPNVTTQFIRATSGNGTAITPYVITDIYGLQGMGSNATTLTQYFNLGENIDATSTASWNSNAGFLPIGNASNYFTGTFNGQNHLIDSLFMNTTNMHTGLFGYASGNAISNVSLTNVDITLNVNNNTNYYVGGLVGLAEGNLAINYTSTSGSVTGAGTVTRAFAGGLVGLLGSYTASINNSFSSATVSSTADAGGLVAASTGAISNSAAFGNVSSNSPIHSTGGLVGWSQFTINNTYSTGNVSSNGGFVGGLVGATDNSVSYSYSSGLVTTVSGPIGGLIGSFVPWGGSVTASYWDTDTSQRSNGVGNISGGSIVSLTGGCFNGTCTNGGTANLSSVAIYSGSGWNITSTPSTTSTAPANTWFIFAGNTRPMLMMENTSSITNTHQLQMMGVALGGSYTLANNIDFSTVTSQADVWNSNFNTGTGAGFIPTGSFTGTFNGNNHTINQLFINRPGTSNVGLFGLMAGSSTVNNLALTNLNVAGSSFVGGVVGRKNAGTLSSVSVTGNVTGVSSYVGGLTGYNVGTINGNSFVAGNVTSTGSTSRLGGLVGENWGNITATAIGDIYFSSGTVHASGTSGSLVGGIIGWNRGGVLSNVFTANTATVTALAHAYVGGLIGQNDATVVNSYSAATVNGGTYVTGGLIGFNYGTISGNTYATGNVAGTQFVGGLMGVNQGGNITPSTLGEIYATGNVTGTWEVGGLIGENYRILSNVSYENHSGGISAPAASYVGGLVGLSFGSSISNSFADTTGTTIIGLSQVGGLVGGNASAISGNSYAMGNVIGSGSNVGGLIGNNASSVTGTVEQPIYATGSVTGVTNVGGLIGSNNTGNIVTNVTVSSTVTGTTNVGGLIGSNAGTLTATEPGVTTVSGTVIGGVNIGAFTGTQTGSGNTSNASIGQLTLEGLTGYNLFAIQSTPIIGTLTITGPGTGTNTLDLSSFSDPGMIITLSSGNAGNIALSGQSGTISFNRMHNVTTGSGDDTLNLSNGSLTGSFDGGAGINTLIGGNAGTTWTINANNGGLVTGLGGNFSNIARLIGGTGLDIFNMMPGFSISGLIDGGDTVNLNNIRLTNHTDRTDLLLSIPLTGNVFEAGSVYTSGNSLIAAFTRVQQSDGNNLGYITLPNKSNITVTFYDSTLLNGEIGDPFYFYGWNIANLPVPAQAKTTVAPPVAQINQQPITNAENNTVSQYYADPAVVNKTYTDPLLYTTSVRSGAACYQVIQ